MAAGTNSKEIESLHSILEKHLPDDELNEVRRILYGRNLPKLDLPADAQKAAEDLEFDLSGYKIDGCATEEVRSPQVVKVGLIQNQIVKPTTESVLDQRQALFERIGRMIDVAARCGVNILCLQEAWTMPFAFCTREKLPWTEFAEPADETGASTKFLSNLAKKYGMVIISPILEREEKRGGILWNTSVIISHTGNVIGR